MSRELFDAVWRNSPARGADLLVLICIADATKEAEGPWITMAVTHMAKRCRLSARSVQLSLQRLTVAGAVSVDAMRGTGGRNRYQVIPPATDQRPAGARPITEAQRNRCRAGAAVRWGMQPDAPGMHRDASPILPSAHPDASPSCIPMHGLDASGCTTPLHPDAQTGATGCTQDSDGTVNRSVTEPAARGVYPPLDIKGTPPVPPVGGEGKPSLRQMVAARMLPAHRDPAVINQQTIDLEAHKSAQAVKPTTGRPTTPRFHHPGD